ncbi:phosphoserine phosphatase SerB [Pseudactinotalea sp. HY160]|uniref:phosphoserine phosphatase SerB n=1 Tax=Pseudactinotalea sp. HY160 TaxID=2654490 RepID=UPI00128B4885|nr:phosphoserine phosphatase SerB [Pseudactinotalea sp. HY160]MPV49851.1 phosphoserine phosphatase SerB [Pseudactinotalea sp. HY160]
MTARHLLVMDVDSTFITSEQIDLLARRAGREAEVAAVTERAMAGELDFTASLRARVAALAGLEEGAIAAVRSELEFTPGALEVVRRCAGAGWPVALVSGGFHNIIDEFVADLPIAYVRANTLVVSGGMLTGEVTGPIIDQAAKERHLRAFAAAEGIDLAHTIAIGDGANDLDMVRAAGLGVAFAAKPVLVAAADLVLPGPRLDDVLTHLAGTLAPLPGDG